MVNPSNALYRGLYRRSRLGICHQMTQIEMEVIGRGGENWQVMIMIKRHTPNKNINNNLINNK